MAHTQETQFLENSTRGAGYGLGPRMGLGWRRNTADCPLTQSQNNGLQANSNNLSASDNSSENPVLNATSSPSQGLLPSATSLFQSGAFGAVLGAATSGFSNYSDYKQGKKTKKDAFSDVAKNTIQGAATMVVASVATHIVRTNPLLGVAALVAGGVGSYIYLQNKIKEEAKEVETKLNQEITDKE